MHYVHKLCKKEQKKKFLAIFLTLVTGIDSISHMKVVLNVSQYVVVVIGHAWLISYAQCAKIVQKRAKNEVFGHFLDLGDSDRLDIADDGSPKRFLTCGSGYRSCMTN